MDLESSQHFQRMKPHFDKCIGVRNSVMHGRPLTIDEYALASSFTSELLKHKVYWPKLNDSYRKYSEDPESITERSVRYLESVDSPETFNNLPSPDYEDTGFFPRPRLEKEIKRKILGRHPVVTILGDGGDGKSSIALQTLYGLIASKDHNFDAIIWVSAKSSKLTGAEIERIETHISSSLSIFDEVAGLFEGKTEQPFERVLQLMEDNKVLLVIDNLETIIDNEIIKFAEEIPGESKLVLTSRIPLGPDLSVHVPPFSSNEALAFLRILISAYGVNALKTLKDDRLTHFASRLHNKPLLLKWFVMGVLSGLNPDKIVANPEVALRFCLENVFDALTAEAKNHVATIALLPRAVSLAMLQHVTEETIQSLESSLAELMRFGIVEQVQDKYETVYQIRPLARSYLVRVLKETSGKSEDYLRRFRQIEGIYQNERREDSHNRYNPTRYTVRSKSEALAVKKLKAAINLGRQNDLVEAFRKIEELKISHPNYFEVYRVEAYISTLNGDNFRAQDAYLSAIEIDETQPQIRWMYGSFLLNKFGDHEGALDQFKKTIELDQSSVPGNMDAARVLMYLLDFESAQGFLTAAVNSNVDTGKQMQILLDLQFQLFCRQIKNFESGRDQDRIKEVVQNLTAFLDGCEVSRIDSVFCAHINKHKDLPKIARRLITEGDLSFLEEFDQSYFSILDASNVKSSAGYGSIGRLKSSGLQENFGFLEGLDGEDTFIHISSVSPEVWSAMIRGEKVRYRISTNDEGKTYANHIELLN